MQQSNKLERIECDWCNKFFDSNNKDEKLCEECHESKEHHAETGAMYCAHCADYLGELYKGQQDFRRICQECEAQENEDWKETKEIIAKVVASK